MSCDNGELTELRVAECLTAEERVVEEKAQVA